MNHWLTLNEPQCFIGLGHREGTQAPGLKLAWMDVLRAMHHSLLAHGRAVQTLREHCAVKPVIGWAPVGVGSYPTTSDPRDVDAARTRFLSADTKELWSNTLFSDPVCLGHYPEDAQRVWGNDFPKFTQSQMDLIRQPIDFYGMNIYQGQPVRAGEDGRAVKVDREPGHAINAYHWPVAPPSLYWGPRFIHERYKLPVYITENGMSCMDWVALDGAVHDPQRIDFTRRYLQELSRAIDHGVDIRGYFHWSLMDNFEWADGYRQRFGLVHVDYRTQKRTLKDSARWYAGVIRNNGKDIRTDSKPPKPAEFVWNRVLDKGNPHPSGIGSDFNRLELEFWPSIDLLDGRNLRRRELLKELIEWRNAIAHQDFGTVGGDPKLHLTQVRAWRNAIAVLAIEFDRAMQAYLSILLGAAPW